MLSWNAQHISYCWVSYFRCRIIGLQPGHSQDSTLFWWFLCIGSAGNAVWWSYFSACFYREASVLPILLANISGAIVNVALTLVATCRTTTLGVKQKLVLESINIQSSYYLFMTNSLFVSEHKIFRIVGTISVFLFQPYASWLLMGWSTDYPLSTQDGSALHWQGCPRAFGWLLLYQYVLALFSFDFSLLMYHILISGLCYSIAHYCLEVPFLKASLWN